MGKYQRTKGHNFERWVARSFRHIFPAAKRGLQSRNGGKEAADVEIPFFHVECKVGARPNVFAAISQARQDILKSNVVTRVPLAIIKKDRHTPIAVMDFSTLLLLLKELSKYVDLMGLKPNEPFPIVSAEDQEPVKE